MQKSQSEHVTCARIYEVHAYPYCRRVSRRHAASELLEANFDWVTSFSSSVISGIARARSIDTHRMNGERESITNGKSKFLTLPGAAGEVAVSPGRKGLS